MRTLPGFKFPAAYLASFFVFCSTYIGAAENQSRDIRQTPSDLSAPEMTCEKPAPGVRSKQFLASENSPNLYYSLYLPTDWTPERKFPLIVEYPGNGPYSNRLGDTNSGRLEDCNLGYGITEGKGAIWICLPFVNPETNSHQFQWWGDVEATVQYCQKAVEHVVETYNADLEKIFLAGFSRGAIACNYIGLHNDEIASIWAGFICHSHYDGVRDWGYEGADKESALRRLQRLKDRPQWISHEDSVATTRGYLEQTGLSLNVTYLSLPFPNHTDQWVLKDIPARRELRKWWNQQTHQK